MADLRKWSTGAVMALCMAGIGSVNAATLSGYGLDINYDADQLGASWTGVLTYNSSSSLATLSFVNASSTTSDYFLKNFSFSITPRSTTQVNQSDPWSEEVYQYSAEDPPRLLGTRSVYYLSSTTYTGGAIYSISSAGNNTLPPFTGVPSAFGENNLSATVTTNAGNLQRQNSFTFLNSTGNNNSVAINETFLDYDNLNPWTIKAGDRVLFQGTVYQALHDASQSPFGYIPSPGIGGSFGAFAWDNKGPVQVFGGELDQPMTVEVGSEVWTPTFLQPGVHHCQGVTCMVAANGQYLASSFQVTLGAKVQTGGELVYGDIVPVPEPETYGMILSGLALLGVVVRRRKQKELA